MDSAIKTIIEVTVSTFSKVKDINKLSDNKSYVEKLRKTIQDYADSTNFKLKDPNKPKCKSAYMWFREENKQEVKDENPKLNAIQLTKIISERWNNLDPKKKKKYEEKAENDKKRCKEELESYVRPSDEELRSLSVNKPRKRRAKKSSSQKKEKVARPKNAYILFAKEMRPIVSADNPDAKSTEITSMLGSMWKGEYKDPSKRAKWVELAEAEKEFFERNKSEKKENQESENQEKDNQESKNQESKNQESENQESENQESENQESENQDEKEDNQTEKEDNQTEKEDNQESEDDDELEKRLLSIKNKLDKSNGVKTKDTKTKDTKTKSSSKKKDDFDVHKELNKYFDKKGLDKSNRKATLEAISKNLPKWQKEGRIDYKVVDDIINDDEDGELVDE